MKDLLVGLVVSKIIVNSDTLSLNPVDDFNFLVKSGKWMVDLRLSRNIIGRVVQKLTSHLQDKLLAAAWKRGGLEAERELREQLQQAEQDRIMAGVRHLIKYARFSGSNFLEKYCKKINFGLLLWCTR